MFSVIIPTHERPELLSRLLHSIVNQELRNYEVIVINDASKSPRYENIIEKFSQIMIDFRYVKVEKNIGASACRNFGAKIAKYEYLAFVDDDDIWLPNKLHVQAELISQHPNGGLFYGSADVRSESGILIDELKARINGDFRSEIYKKCFIPSPTVVVKREHFFKAGGFDQGLKCFQDWDLWIRLSKLTTCWGVDETIAVYSKHPYGNIGNSKNLQKSMAKFYFAHSLGAFLYSSFALGAHFIKRAFFLSFFRRSAR